MANAAAAAAPSAAGPGIEATSADVAPLAVSFAGQALGAAPDGVADTISFLRSCSDQAVVFEFCAWLLLGAAPRPQQAIAIFTSPLRARPLPDDAVLEFLSAPRFADVARRTGVVFRLDSECRSEAYMQKTANLVLNGYLGNIKRFEVGVPQEMSEGFGDASPMPVPEHLDYDMWLGPAPAAPYTVDRVHRTDTATGKYEGRPGWLRLSDYCAGMICNWGGHLLDVANFINGTSATGPISVEGKGKFPDQPGGLWDTIIEFEVQYKYANGVVLDYKIDQPYLRVEGDKGWIQAHWYSKGGLQASDSSILHTKFSKEDKRVPSRSDKQDFINAIINKEAVMIDAEAGHRVNSQCLLGLAAIKTGKRLEWDPVKEVVTNSPEGEKLMKASFHREAWKLERFL